MTTNTSNRIVEKTFSKKAKIIIHDEVNCMVVGLQPDHHSYFYEEYGIYAENYFFTPKYKIGSWDGKIRYFTKDGHTYVLLLDEIIKKIVKFGYKITIDDRRINGYCEVPLIDENYLCGFINTKTDEPYIVRPYQVSALNSVFGDGFGIIIAGTGAGKSQPLDCKIATPNGWQLMGDIRVGTTISSPSGNNTKVIGVFPQGVTDQYELEFHDGSKTRTSGEHLWDCNFPISNNTFKTMRTIKTTNDMIKWLDFQQGRLVKRGNISIPMVNPVEFLTQELIVDPYIIGALLGDGSLSHNNICISSADEFIITKISERLINLGVVVKHNTNYDYRICKKQRNNWKSNELHDALDGLGLVGTTSGTKFIPSCYKFGSIEQRWQLIQGLFDTDGTADKRGNCSYTTISEQLANDMQEVLWSLGCTCTITTRFPTYSYKGRQLTGQLAYTLFVRYVQPKQLFSLPKKISRCRDIHADGRIQLNRRLVNIKKLDDIETQCIMVDDPNHLYITDDYIVTHNTTINTILVDHYEKLHGLRSITIVPSISLIGQTVATFEEFALDVGRYDGEVKDLKHQHIVSTWQALQNYPQLMKQFQVVVVDECHGIKGRKLTNLLIEHGRHITHRFGLTGTLPKGKADAMAVRIAIGPVRYTIPAHELIEQGWLATPNITVLQMDDITRLESLYDEDNNISFDTEVSFLQTDNTRLSWMADYIAQKGTEDKGNVLCLVTSVTFGKKLKKLMPDAYFLYGKDKQKVRKEVYDLFETHDNLVVIATVQIAGVGLSIDRIFNLVFVDGGKSFIRIIQMIGRGLRKGKDKDTVDVTDICSNLDYSREHLRQRIKYYKEAQYKFTKKVIKYE